MQFQAFMVPLFLGSVALSSHAPKGSATSPTAAPSVTTRPMVDPHEPMMSEHDEKYERFQARNAKLDQMAEEFLADIEHLKYSTTSTTAAPSPTTDPMTDDDCELVMGDIKALIDDVKAAFDSLDKVMEAYEADLEYLDWLIMESNLMMGDEGATTQTATENHDSTKIS